MSLSNSLNDELDTHISSDEVLRSAVLTVLAENTLNAEVFKVNDSAEAGRYRDSWYETLQIENASLTGAVQARINSFKNSWVSTTDQETTISVGEPEVVKTTDEWQVRAEFSLKSTATEWVSEFGTRAVDASGMIPSVDSLREMNVRIILEDDLQPFDYTIYFATQHPHKYWADCDTLEDYFALVAEQNEDTTIKDIRNKSEYLTHTHLLNNQESVDAWFKHFIRGCISTNFESEDSVTINPGEFRTEFDGYTLSGSIIQSL